MIAAALIVLLTVGSSYLAYQRIRRQAAAAIPTTQPEYLPSPHTFSETPQPPRALEVAHVQQSGALALNAANFPRVRPGHRCVEEVRKRCHVDFIGAMNFLEGQLNRKVSDDPLEQARYWIDLAEGLRVSNLHESLPALL